MFARNINPFVPNAPFIYLLKTENLTVQNGILRRAVITHSGFYFLILL